MTDPEFYHPEEVRKLLGVSEPTLWRLRQADFPAPVRLTKRKVVYPAQAVHAWIARRLSNGAA